MQISPWGTRRDRERERATKREAVLCTAVKLFNLKGFHAASLDDVAMALNVTKPTIYHYFSSKDEILFECVRRGLDGVREAAEKAAARGGSGMERLCALMREYALIMTHDFGICVTRTNDAELTPESRREFRSLKRQIDRIIRGVIEDGVQDGTIAPTDPRVAAFTIAGALNWIARWYDPRGKLTAEEIAEQTVATLVRGLAPQERGR